MSEGERGREMGVRSEEVVVMKVAKSEVEASVITVNCPDKTGLGCDLCWIILEYGLRITRADLGKSDKVGGEFRDVDLVSVVLTACGCQGDLAYLHLKKGFPFPDISTDGKWCYVIFWVVPRSSSINVQWIGLKRRLLSACPTFSVASYLNLSRPPTVEPPVYLLKLFCINQKGLLHDVTHVLCELELLIHRVKVSTTPDGKVMDLFFFTDGMELMHTKARQEETCSRLYSVLGEFCEKCEIQLPGPEYDDFQKGISPISSEVAKNLFSREISNSGLCSQTLRPDLNKMTEARINLDNSLSPAYTLLQIHCADQKSLLYDILRTLKDCNIHVAYNRCLSDMKGNRELDLFIQQSDGRKILDPEKQDALRASLKMEMLHPLRVIIVSRGPDTELLVANPVEASGKGRPRVFYDVTLALRVLGVCVFSAEIGRHTTPERQWEVYRFLLDENCQFELANSNARSQIVDTVRKTLMGW